MPEKDSNLKTSFPEIPKRLGTSRLRRKGILAYDQDNLYPQRMELLVKGSATGRAVHDLYKKTINGEGFRDQGMAAFVVNDKGDTFNSILKKIAKDAAYHWGYALHLNMDVSGQIHQIQHIPFRFVRLPDEDDTSVNKGRYAVYPDWEMQKWRNFDPSKLDWIDPFNPDPVVIEQQIFNSGDGKNGGNINTWKGQLLYWTPEDGGYTESPFDCSLSDLETDQELALFRNSTVLTSFLASYAAIFKQKVEDKKESAKIDENLMSVQGGRKAGKVIRIEGVGEDPDAVTFQKLDTIDHDGLFEQTETSTQKNIRKAVKAPGELVGEEFSSGFDTERINNQRRYYNSVVRFERDEISEVFKKLAPYFAQPVNSSGDFSIIPLYEDELEGGIKQDNTVSVSVQGEKQVAPNDQPVEKTALNGIQISSMKDIVLEVTVGNIDKSTAKALLKAAFPALSIEEISAIIDPVEIKTIKPNGTVN